MTLGIVFDLANVNKLLMDLHFLHKSIQYIKEKEVLDSLDWFKSSPRVRNLETVITVTCFK